MCLSMDDAGLGYWDWQLVFVFVLYYKLVYISKESSWHCHVSI